MSMVAPEQPQVGGGCVTPIIRRLGQGIKPGGKPVEATCGMGGLRLQLQA
jgi:hypothetical protein